MFKYLVVIAIITGVATKGTFDYSTELMQYKADRHASIMEKY